MTEILYCTECKLYTLKLTCSRCKKVSITTKPAKYSPQDRYGKYRRLAKIEEKKII